MTDITTTVQRILVDETSLRVSSPIFAVLLGMCSNDLLCVMSDQSHDQPIYMYGGVYTQFAGSNRLMYRELSTLDNSE